MVGVFGVVDGGRGVWVVGGLNGGSVVFLVV